MKRQQPIYLYPLLFLALCACNQTAPETAMPIAQPAPTGYAVRHVAPDGYKLPEGAGCSGAVARYQAVMDNDYATGNVGLGVFKTISDEISAARAACAAGNDGQASGMISASRSRHGYPNG